MEKKALITGENPLSELLAKGLKPSGYKVFLGTPDQKKKDAAHTWNPRSPISTRALITESLRSLERIDDIIMVFTPPGLENPFYEMSARAIETAVDRYIKGPLFLIREALNTASRQESCTVQFVLFPEPAGTEHPLDQAIRNTLITFIDSLFTIQQGDSVHLHGFRATDMDIQEYAEAIITAVTGKQRNYKNRWQRFGSTQGFLSSLPFTGRNK